MPRFSRCSTLVCLALIAALFTAVDAAPSGSPPSGGEPFNMMCPVTPEEPVDPEIFTDHQGQRIAFCCQRCKRQFERDPQAYLASLRTVSPSTSNVTPDSGDGHGHSSHDHGSDDLSESSVSHLLHWFGKFHPASVHLPIGLLMAAALAELLLLLTGNDFFTGAARFCVALGAAGAVGAAALGWLYGGFHLSDQDWLMTTHRWTGTSTGAWSIVVLLMCETRQRRPESRWATGYRASLFLGAALVSLAGFLGGSLVYGLDHYGW